MLNFKKFSFTYLKLSVSKMTRLIYFNKTSRNNSFILSFFHSFIPSFSSLVRKGGKLYWSVILLICLPFLAACSPSQDFNNEMANLAKNLPNVVKLIVAIAYVMGIWFIYSGFYTLKIYGDMRTMMATQGAGFGGPAIKILIGAALMMMPGMVHIAINSLWSVGNEAVTIVEYPTVGTGWQGWEPAIRGVIEVIRVLGYISFVRGFHMLGKATKQSAQPGMYGKGMMHVFGGVLAINIVGTIDIIRNSFGIS